MVLDSKQLIPEQAAGSYGSVDAKEQATAVRIGGYGGTGMTVSPSRQQLVEDPNYTAVAPKLQIVYTDLSYSIKVKEPKTGWRDKVIIKGVTGIIQPARITAVMGASGAGKTTFLNVLAGYAQGQVTVGGTVTVNGEVVKAERMRQISGFVHQEDSILDTMTVREALYMSAELKLPPGMSRAAKLRRAIDVSLELNLTKAMDNIVGSALTKGISGGEKRRLSLGMEMITNPSALFLDEPTSGLDTHTAHKVVSILRTVAHKQFRNIVCTIHQPSSDIFHMFDDLIVLADGMVMYHGLADNLVSYFARLGYQCPQYTNPADYLFMDVLNRGVLLETANGDEAAGEDQSMLLPGIAAIPGAVQKATELVIKAGAAAPTPNEAAAAQAKAVEELRVHGLLEAWTISPENAAMSATLKNGTLLADGIGAGAVQHYAGFPMQFAILSMRAGRNQWRNKLILQGKAAQTLILSLICGLIFLNLKNDLKGIQNREGSLFFLVVQGLFGSVMGAITTFGTEKVVFKREYESRLYGLPAFFWSRFIVELPLHIVFPIMSACITYWMIGFQADVGKFFWFVLTLVLVDNCGAGLGMFVACVFNDVATAMAVMPVFLMPLMIFSGFFVNSKSIPIYLRWIQYISPMHYAFFAVAENEFTGLVIHCTPAQNCAANYSGSDVVTLLGISLSVGTNNAILFALFVGLVGMANLALWNTVRSISK